MRYRGALGWMLGMTVMLVASGVAQAATVMNTNDSGQGSLRQAIIDSVSGGTIDFAPGVNGQIRPRCREPHDRRQRQQRHRVRHQHHAARLHIGNDLRSNDHGRPRQGPGRGRDLREQPRRPHLGRRRHHRQSIDAPYERLVRRRRSLRQRRDGERVQQHDHQQHDLVQRLHHARRRQQ